MMIELDGVEYNLTDYNTRVLNNTVVKTPYGIMKSIKMKNYGSFSNYEFFLKKSCKWSKVFILEKKLKNKTPQEMKDVIEKYGDYEFLDMIKNNEDGLKDFFINLLKKIILRPHKIIKQGKMKKEIVVSYDELLDIVTGSEADWNRFRHYVLDYNAIYYKEKNDNDEIAEYDALSDEVAKSKGAVLTFSSKYSAVQLAMKFTNEQMDELSLLNFNLLFYQKGKFVNNRDTAIWKMLDSDMTHVHWAEAPETKKVRKGIAIGSMGLSSEEIKEGTNKNV